MNHPYLLQQTGEVEVDIVETGDQQDQDGGDQSDIEQGLLAAVEE